MGWVRPLRARSRSSFLKTGHSVATTSASQPSATSFISGTYVMAGPGFKMSFALSIALGSWRRRLAPSLSRRWQSSMAGLSRTSSVFCLKARPSTPIFLSLSTQSVSVIFLTKRYLPRVDALDFLEQGEVVTELLGNLDE